MSWSPKWLFQGSSKRCSLMCLHNWKWFYHFICGDFRIQGIQRILVDYVLIASKPQSYSLSVAALLSKDLYIAGLKLVTELSELFRNVLAKAEKKIEKKNTKLSRSYCYLIGFSGTFLLFRLKNVLRICYTINKM